uniref:Uncharacterized protein n=1 Tax=Phaeomonas parva TaxID=124430 RepID=A0A7S1UIV9_9STRA|mmetsp:Transcript_7629/g.22049  ORF Transcript_7629/g.22049 Transcript_7629/m.22049 type:complete len:186 (+) Transcript_7629:1-558(+)
MSLGLLASLVLGLALRSYSGIDGGLSFGVGLTSQAWVPGLFAVAGLLISLLYATFDARVPSDEAKIMRNIGAMRVRVGIFMFALQYAASGALQMAGVLGVKASLILWIWALSFWAIFDGTKAGMLTSAITALGGPALEYFLINKLGLYTYLLADWKGMCSWIPAVYFMGGPAVGNLYRFWASMKW